MSNNIWGDVAAWIGVLGAVGNFAWTTYRTSRSWYPTFEFSDARKTSSNSNGTYYTFSLYILNSHSGYSITKLSLYSKNPKKLPLIRAGEDTLGMIADLIDSPKAWAWPGSIQSGGKQEFEFMILLPLNNINLQKIELCFSFTRGDNKVAKVCRNLILQN